LCPAVSFFTLLTLALLPFAIRTRRQARPFALKFEK